MKAFSDPTDHWEYSVPGIFCDVKEIEFQIFAPGFAPDFKVFHI